MRIIDLLSEESIEIGVSLENKRETIIRAVDLMEKTGVITDREDYERKVFQREEEGTTGVGDFVAIPHGRSSGVERPQLAALTIPAGVDYESLDGEDVKLLFLIAVPDNDSQVHLDILSKLSQMLMHPEFIEKLIKAKTKGEFLSIIDSEESKVDESEIESNKNDESKKIRIVAVTGCPTGIAHTYMAAEALNKKAEELGYDIKVETRGSGGAKNVLSSDEIEMADGVIVASDTQVPMDRFDGKKIVITQVSDGISKPEQLIEKVLSDSARIYKGENKGESEMEKVSNTQQIYKFLMNGVSHMLPFVVGGGILIALSFLIDGFSVDMNSLSEVERAGFGSINPIAAKFNQIGGVAFGFMLPILAGYISMAIADRPGLAAGFVGGAIAASGTSGFLGALAAGFLAGYIVKLLIKSTENIPKSIDGIRPILIYPLLGILLMGLAMLFIIEPIVGQINIGLNSWLSSLSGTSSVLLGAILGGMMAIDMGGPFNKAAYVFGTAQIAAGNYNIMASVMIGGMVPPCAIALATILFKNKFTLQERKSGPVNFIMGLSFITEGAIPFAAADPIKVIPSCIVGSALAGGLSALFGCTLMAPHGGIFVFPVVGNALMYLVSLALGTVASAILLGALKKKVE
ncbi:MAG: fructose-specific PTS transporter subunit EIIC [Tissierellia bacterium]|nr:fructose-specific PTS transporter subunit EIIC [Tissierellia bacterium]